jgi:uncharacterized DUF497 family protein
MPYHEFFWTERAEQKVEDNGLSVEEVEYAVLHSHESTRSNSSGRPAYVGELPDGRGILVIYDEIDELMISVITAVRIYD